mgnify:CR=1 FL=1
MAAVGLALVAGAAVTLLYGPDYRAAEAPLRILAAGLLPLFLNALLSWAILARGLVAVLGCGGREGNPRGLGNLGDYPRTNAESG